MTTLQEMILEDKPTLVDFYATWCGPCKMMEPILEDLKGKIGDLAHIVKVDVDKNPDAAVAYQVQAVPTLILFKNGQIVWRQSGVVTSAVLENLINQYKK